MAAHVNNNPNYYVDSMLPKVLSCIPGLGLIRAVAINNIFEELKQVDGDGKRVVTKEREIYLLTGARHYDIAGIVNSSLEVALFVTLIALSIVNPLVGIVAGFCAFLLGISLLTLYTNSLMLKEAKEPQKSATNPV